MNLITWWKRDMISVSLRTARQQRQPRSRMAFFFGSEQQRNSKNSGWNGVNLPSVTCEPGGCPEPGGSGCCDRNHYGTQCSHPAQKDTDLHRIAVVLLQEELRGVGRDVRRVHRTAGVGQVFPRAEAHVVRVVHWVRDDFGRPT